MRRLLTITLALTAVAAAPAHAVEDATPNIKLAKSVPLQTEVADVAFWGDRAAVGKIGDGEGEDGFYLYDISNPRDPKKVSEFKCANTHFDTTLWGDLVILADNYQHAGEACEDPGLTFGDGFAGIRLVSVADERNPKLVKNVDTGCVGAHTHTVIPDPANDRLVVWVNAGGGPQIYNPADFLSCDTIVEIPLKDPSKARKLGTRPLGNGIATCHDVTVNMARKIAAGNCLSELRFFDISDPTAPTILGAIPIPATTIIHGSSFSNDGNVLAVSDEQLPGQAGLGGVGGCFGSTVDRIGAIYFYDVSNPSLPVERGHFQVPRSGDSYCTAHQSNVVPLPDQTDILVSGWYERGASVIDFTEPSEPREIAHYTRDDASYWSGYWYNGFIYATNFEGRSFDVLELTDPAVKEWIRTTRLDAQTNEPIDAIRAKLSLAAAAKGRLKARRRGTLTVTVTRSDGLSRYPAQGATVVVGKVRARTNARGVAKLRVRPARRGTLRGRVTRPGYPAAPLRIRVR